MNDSRFVMPSIKVPVPASNQLAAAQLKAATTAVDEVAGEIRRFQESLTENEEAWFSMVGAGGGLMVQPHQLRALGIDKFVVEGVDQDGRRVRAIQHVSQVNVTLVAVVADKPRRMGFGE